MDTAGTAALLDEEPSEIQSQFEAAARFCDRRPGILRSVEHNNRSLTPGKNPRLGSIRFEDWLSRSPARR
jgi:hypothetical protein